MGFSGYSPETEQKVEQLLAALYKALQIQKPDDLYGSVVIETRYQNGRPIGQVDVNIRYVMKRTDAVGRNAHSTRKVETNGVEKSRRNIPE